MPFIRGRYHINPIAGEALEAARDAEAALLALEQAARNPRDANDDFAAPDDPQGAPSSPGPIHRVEIEAAELVPSQTGRAARGYVARVHRSVSVAPHAGSESPASSLFSSRGSTPAKAGAAPADYAGTTDVAVRPETHVFSNHGDLLDFLRDQLSRGAKA